MEDTSAVVDSSPAPSAPVSAPSAEPSPAAPPSTDRPTSMRDAFAKVAERRAADKGTAPAIAAPATTDGLPAKQPGPIPFEVHKTALDNARTKASEEAAQQWKDYEFVRGIPASDLREFVSMVQQHKGDPIAMLQHLASEIAADPVHSQALRAFAGKQLAAARGQQAATDMPQPDLEVTDQNGNVVARTYSDQGQAKRDELLEARILQKLSPVTQMHEQITKAQAHLAEVQQAQSWGAELGKDMNSWPGFHPEQNKAERAAVKERVKQLVDALPADKQRDATSLENALHRAYREVVHPKLPSLMQAQLAASLKQKAVAQVENPSGTAPVTTARPKNPKELAKFLEQRAAARRR
jgi:hypothetical protein